MSRKVLVVDDEKLIVKGLRFSLEQDGMEVDCAYDGEEALQMASNKEYDIILLDVMLLNNFCSLKLVYLLSPIIMWSNSGISICSPAPATLSVSSLSALLGVGSPLG